METENIGILVYLPRKTVESATRKAKDLYGKGNKRSDLIQHAVELYLDRLEIATAPAVHPAEYAAAPQRADDREQTLFGYGDKTPVVASLAEARDTLSRSLFELERDFGVKDIRIFGSYARNEQTSKSDIDLLVDLEEPLGLRFMELKERLELLLGRNVDLVSRNALKDSIKDEIIREAVAV